MCYRHFLPYLLNGLGMHTADYMDVPVYCFHPNVTVAVSYEHEIITELHPFTISMRVSTNFMQKN